MKTIKNVIKISVLSVALSFSSNSKADLGSIMDELFEDTMMVNSVEASAYAGQSRGVMQGGAFRMRSKIAPAPKFIAFKPPSMSAGCGGINVFGGSMSFISGEELVGYLRAIGANSVGYFFKLALNATCPTCATLMAELDKMMKTMNSALADSCSATKSLFKAGDVSGKLKGNAFSKITDSVIGKTGGSGLTAAVGDMHEFLKSDMGLGEAATDTDSKKLVQGNVIYDALRLSKFEEMFENYLSVQGVTMTEIAMSIYGTAIIGSCDDEVADSDGFIVQAGQEDLCTKPISPTIVTLSDFRGTLNSDGEILLTVLKCDGGYLLPGNKAKCLSPTTEIVTMEPMQKKIKELIIGSQTRYGLIEYLGDKNPGAMTADIKGLLENVSEPIMRMLKELSLRPGSARSFAIKYADRLANDILFDFFVNLTNASLKAIKSTENEVAIITAEKSRKVLYANLDLETTKLVAKETGSQGMWLEYKQRVEIIEKYMSRSSGTSLPSQQQ